VNQAHEDFGRRLSALRADFAALGTRAADAASALAAKLPPPPALLDELSAARDAFAELRDAMVDHASELALVLDGEHLSTLRDLEPVLAAIGAAEDRQVQRRAWEEARESALVVLDRVMELIHREDASFGALAACQARARELHGALSASTPADLAHETVMMTGILRPFTELLALVEAWNVLDDDRCAFLQDAVTQAFGRPLALAALRGKLGREGELPPEPSVRGRAGEAAYPPGVYSPSGSYAAAAAHSGGPGPDAAVPAYPAAPVSQPAYPADLPAYPPAAPAYAASGGAAAAAPPPAAGVVVTGPPGVTVSGGGIPATGAGGPVSPGGSSPVVEIRLSGDKINVETPEARREREKQLEKLARESAQWWIAARDGWRAMRERDATFAAAARDFLQRFPTLLSVPLQKSAEPEGRQVAEGYALLLAHIEKLEEGFVREALTRLNPQFTTRERDKAYPLGQELYLYVVAEGRLYKTYPDFVKDVVVAALPESGPWVQGGLIEGDDETRRFTRRGALGSREEQTEVVSGWRERIGPHVFTATAGPLTARFFTLRLSGGALADPPDVEIRLKENDAPTDHAWLIALPMPGAQAAPLAPKKHRTGGTTLAGFGKDFGALWIAVFNADPSNERTYELELTLRRKPPTEAPRAMKAPAQSPVAGKFFGRSR
jgi:hypothetical protein